MTDGGTISDAALSGPDQRDVRSRIVAEAKALFAHYGYAKTNIGDIAAACGMSPANLYRYFRNKQAIGNAVVQVFLIAQNERTNAALSEPAASVEERFRRFLTVSVMNTVEHIRRAPKLVQLAEMLFETPEGTALIEAHSMEDRALLLGLIEEGRRCGEFKIADAEAAARATQLATKFFHVPFTIARHGLDQVEDDLSVTLDLICAGLRSG